MKKKMRKSILNSLKFFTIILMCIFLLPSCNNENKKENSEEQATTVETNSNSNDSLSKIKMLAPNQDSLPYLAMPKKTLDSLFLDVSCSKISFAFQFDNMTTTPSLVAFGMRGATYIDNKPQYKLDKSSSKEEIKGEYYLSTLELSINQYRRLKRNPASDTSNFLIFKPQFYSIYKKSVVYVVSWASDYKKDNLKILLYPEELKPSPPSNP